MGGLKLFNQKSNFNFYRLISDNDIETHINEVCTNGYTIIKNYLKYDYINIFENKLNIIYENNLLNSKFFDKGVPVGHQSIIKDDQIINNLVAYDKDFIDIATTGDHLKVLRFFLNDPFYGLIPKDDPNFLLAQLNARAGKVALPLHIDTRMVTQGFSTWAMQGFLVISNININNGGLRVKPASHMGGVIPDSIDSFNNDENIIDLLTNKGDFVLFSSQLHHATYASDIKNLWTILFTYRCWWCKQQFALYELVNHNIYSILFDNQKLLLGAASVTPSNINASASSRVGYENLWKPEIGV